MSTTEKKASQSPAPTQEEARSTTKTKKRVVEQAKEVGGRDGPEPTRYGDWEKKGLISDF